LDGDALVMMHSDRTIDLNDQSSPLNSWSVTSKRLAFNASAVSLAAASPIALTVSEKVIDLGENTAPTCVRSIECSGSTLSENVGMNESIGVICTWSWSSSTYETASRVLQSITLSISRAPAPLELRLQRHPQAVNRRAVGDADEHVDCPVGAGVGDELPV